MKRLLLAFTSRLELSDKAVTFANENVRLGVENAAVKAELRKVAKERDLLRRHNEALLAEAPNRKSALALLRTINEIDGLPTTEASE